MVTIDLPAPKDRIYNDDSDQSSDDESRGISQFDSVRSGSVVPQTMKTPVYMSEGQSIVSSVRVDDDEEPTGEEAVEEEDEETNVLNQ